MHSLEALIYFSTLGFNMKALAFAVIVVVYALISTRNASGKCALSTTCDQRRAGQKILGLAATAVEGY